MRWRTFAVSMWPGLPGGSLGHAQAERTADRVHLTLSSQTVWQGTHGWCSFSAEIGQGRGGVFSPLRWCGSSGRHDLAQAGR